MFVEMAISVYNNEKLLEELFNLLTHSQKGFVEKLDNYIDASRLKDQEITKMLNNVFKAAENTGQKEIINQLAQSDYINYITNPSEELKILHTRYKQNTRKVNNRRKRQQFALEQIKQEEEYSKQEKLKKDKVFNEQISKPLTDKEINEFLLSIKVYPENLQFYRYLEYYASRGVHIEYNRLIDLRKQGVNMVINRIRKRYPDSDINV
jgi:hypothetical protein